MSSGMSPAGAVPPGLGGCGVARLGVHCHRLCGVPLVFCTRVPVCPTVSFGDGPPVQVLIGYYRKRAFLGSLETSRSGTTTVCQSDRLVVVRLLQPHRLTHYIQMATARGESDMHRPNELRHVLPCPVAAVKNHMGRKADVPAQESLKERPARL